MVTQSHKSDRENVGDKAGKRKTKLAEVEKEAVAGPGAALVATPPKRPQTEAEREVAARRGAKGHSRKTGERDR